MQNIPFKWLLWLILFLSGLFLLLSPIRPLFVPDEGRYSEIAREMFQTGQYLIPHLNGVIYFEKPILFYWLVAGAFHLFGVTVWAARLVNVVLGVAGCLVTYYATKTLFHSKTGFIAACLLGTSLLYTVMAQMVSLDLPVTVFIAGCLYAFLIGFYTTSPLKRRWWIYAACSSAALAVLTKGLIGIFFPIVIIGLWLTLTHQWGALKKCYLPTAILLFLCLALPWHGLVSLQYPDFLHFYIIEQHLLRYTDRTIGHPEPMWFFVPYVFIGFLPWVVFLPRTIRTSYQAVWPLLKTAHTKQSAIVLFFIIWVIFVFLFFSFSKSKLIPYILPLFPALAILTAHAMTTTLSMKNLLWITVGTGILWVSLFAIAATYDTRSIWPLAQSLKPRLTPHDEVITYNQYYQDLPFYLERRVSILNWKNELSLGMNYADTHQWMINDKQFWHRFHHVHTVYVVMSQSEWALFKKRYPNEKAKLISHTATTVLMSNSVSS